MVVDSHSGSVDISCFSTPQLGVVFVIHVTQAHENTHPYVHIKLYVAWIGSCMHKRLQLYERVKKVRGCERGPNQARILHWKTETGFYIKSRSNSQHRELSVTTQWSPQNN